VDVDETGSDRQAFDVEYVGRGSSEIGTETDDPTPPDCNVRIPAGSPGTIEYDTAPDQQVVATLFEYLTRKRKAGEGGSARLQELSSGSSHAGIYSRPATVSVSKASHEVTRQFDPEAGMLRSKRRSTEQMEIIDEHGVSVGRVIRPTDPRPLGSDKGTIYLQRMPRETSRHLA